MYVKELAKRAGVSPATVRYYSKIGLLHPDRNYDNDYQIYGEVDAHRLRFIRTARALGFTLGDIREFIDLADSGESPCMLVKERLKQRAYETGTKISEMKALHSIMLKAIEEWAESDHAAQCVGEYCGLIEFYMER